MTELKLIFIRIQPYIIKCLSNVPFLKNNKLLIYRVGEKYRNSKISRKLSILEKSVSDKSCRVSKDLFTDLINLTLGGVAKVRSTSHQLFSMELPTFYCIFL